MSREPDPAEATRLRPDVVDRLRYYEGDYHYPGGLLNEAAQTITALRAEVRVDDELLASYRRLLDLFECPVHGPGCIPHAIADVKRLREVEAQTATITQALQQREADVISFCSIVGVEAEEDLEPTLERWAVERRGSQ
jgi:hypothetical protein